MRSLRLCAALPAHTFEFRFVPLLVHETAARAAALGPVLLALHLGLELRAFAHGALAGVVADGLVDGHGFLRWFGSATDKVAQSSLNDLVGVSKSQCGRSFTLATKARTSGMMSGSSARSCSRVMPGRTFG